MFFQELEGLARARQVPQIIYRELGRIRDFLIFVFLSALPYCKAKNCFFVCLFGFVLPALQTSPSCGDNQSGDNQQPWILGKREHAASSTPPSRAAKKAKRSSTSFTAAAERSLGDASSQGKESSQGGSSQQGGLSASPAKDGWLCTRKAAKQQKRGAGGTGDGELSREGTVGEERESEEPKEEEEDEALNEPALTEVRK